MIFKSLAGMKDILPQEALLWQFIEKKSRKIFSLYGYQPIQTPILENSSLFNRCLGQETDIVKKQMFTVNRDDEAYCLRPEATAAVARAYLENNLDKSSRFIKLYYQGPMFRAERPQKGRLRQFHHIGVEAIGSNSPYLDSEVIALAKRLIDELNIKGYTIRINSLGCLDDRAKFSRILRERMEDKVNGLCPDCKERFKSNIFRVLDCKNESCRGIRAGIEISREDYLCQGCLSHFETVKNSLRSLNVPYEVSAELVRGLDYYTGTVFEISHPGLGAQDALGAGGRYDNLIKGLGGENTGAVGFALGVERLMIAANNDISATPAEGLKVFLISLGEQARKEGFRLLEGLRAKGIACDMDYEDKSLKSQMRKADGLGVEFAAIIADNELSRNTAALKDMRSGEQEEIILDKFIDALKEKLNLRR